MLTNLSKMVRVDLIENETFEQQLKIAEGGNHLSSRGKAFWAEETTSAKALGWEHAWCVLARRLEESECKGYL